MNFCSNCGAPATGSAYCGNCGAPMTASAAAQAAAPAQAGPGASAPGGAAAPGGMPAPGGTPASGGVPAGGAARNPFADIPVLDYARDIVALVLLLVSFGMPWDLTDTVTGKVYVVLVTLLSVLSLSLPYLKRGGVLPTSWGTAELRLARLAANAPYVVVVLITLVLGYVGENNGDGVGVGMTFGLAGALLAAQGREAEQSPTGDGAVWRWITLGIGGLFALLTLVSIITFLTDAAEGADWEVVAAVIVSMLFFLALAALPLLGVLRGDGAWRDVLLLVGLVALFVGVWQLGAEQTMRDSWSLSTFGPQLILVPALAVAAAAPGLRSQYRQTPGAAYWSGVGTRMFELVMVTAAAGAVLYVLGIIGVEDGRGLGIVVLVLMLILALAALVGRNALVRDPNAGRAIAVVAGGVFILLGIVVAAILGASDDGTVAVVDAAIISVLWWVGVALLVVLTAPPSVRAEYGPVGASQLNLSSVLPGNGNGNGASAPAAAGAATGAAASAAGAAAARPAEAKADAAKVKADEAKAAAETKAKPDDAKAAAATKAKADDVKTKADAKAEAEPAETKAADDPEGGEVPASPEVPADDAKPAAAGEGLLSGEAKPGPISGLAVGQSAADDTATRIDQQRVEPATRVDQPAVSGAPGFDARTALDPNTPLQTLADIAAQEPGLRKYVAANPSTYPELLTWLSQLGDPEIDEALRRR
ncbi:zinc ribbon domain-containing protein [Jiangella muralis]|uniref:zinc ribbon domain-containing protein n=1 Tax=Jiangella muralis TaxID=702383 RepID=UPI00069E8A55|nr:zinc ribbon domain-containing protein [Jiangella muralis]